MYHDVHELSLNHNHLTKLDGIQQFKNLRSLQLNFNRICSWDEFLKIQNPSALQELSIKGNPNLDIPVSNFGEMQSMVSPRSPMSSKQPQNAANNREIDWLLSVFPNLRILNGQVIQCQPQIMQEDAKSTMNTDYFGTGNFTKPRLSEDILINIGSSRSANAFGSENNAVVERQDQMSQQLNSLDTSHESVTSNYKKKRQMSMLEHQMGVQQQL